MKTSEFQLGQRVRRRTGDSSFVRDRNNNPLLQGRRIGIVVGLPEFVSPQHRAVRVQWESSTRIDQVLIHRLEALPLNEQPVALGGSWQRGPGPLLSS